jgi:hypothetical protein
LNAVIGSTFYNWWEDTRIGCWSNRKLDQWLSWTTQKLHMKDFAKTENLMDRIYKMETQIDQLYKKMEEINK